MSWLTSVCKRLRLSLSPAAPWVAGWRNLWKSCWPAQGHRSPVCRSRRAVLSFEPLETRLAPSFGALLQTFTDPNNTARDIFGSSVAAVGSNVLVGAFGVNGSKGAAYLYNPSGTLLQSFTDPNNTAYDSFGSSVAAVGNDVLIGAYGVNGFKGAAYLYNPASATPNRPIVTFTDPTTP
jgi:hypothetical protein